MIEHKKLIKKNQILLNINAAFFDLSELGDHISDATQHVFIQADTVYMSKPLNLTVTLNITSRKTFISSQLIMNVESGNTSQFMDKHYEFDNGLQIRHRNFGLIDIKDTSSSVNSVLSEKAFEVILEQYDTSRYI